MVVYVGLGATNWWIPPLDDGKTPVMVPGLCALMPQGEAIQPFAIVPVLTRIVSDQTPKRSLPAILITVMLLIMSNRRI